MRVGLLVNPAAGGGRGRAVAREARTLLRGHEVREVETDRRAGAGGEAAALAEAVDVLAPVGGDGTLREVVEALAGRRGAPPLLPVPAGRGNSTVAHLYGDDGWREAAAGLAPDPPTRPLDAGVVEGPEWGPRVFVLGASVGLMARAVQAAERLPLRGGAGYPLGTLWAWLAGAADPVRVEVDGEVLHDGPARLAAAGGGAVRGGGTELFPGASLADGLLDVLVVGDVPLRRLPKLAGAVREGTHPDLEAVEHVRGKEARLERRHGGPAELDGTLFEAPATLEAAVQPGAAAVVVAPPRGSRPPRGAQTES